MGNAVVAKEAPAFGKDYASEYSDPPPYWTSKPDGRVKVRYAKGKVLFP